MYIYVEYKFYIYNKLGICKLYYRQEVIVFGNLTYKYVVWVIKIDYCLQLSLFSFALE